MITFNDPKTSKERSRTKPLSLKQEERVIKILNERLTPGWKGKVSKADIKLIQRFVNHYQNLCHYRAYTGGLVKAANTKESLIKSAFFAGCSSRNEEYQTESYTKSWNNWKRECKININSK